VSALIEQAETLRRFHTSGPLLVLPNAWDAASARIFESAGYTALATTSAGIAYSQGYPDGERISRAEMLAVVARITAHVSVPVTADMEAGYGRAPEAVAETVRGVVAAGAVGMNLEDWSETSGGLFERALAIERVRGARAAADRAGVPIVINARTDVFRSTLPPGDHFDEAARRGNAFREAGADCVFVPFVRDTGTIERLVKAIAAPINILGGPNAPSLKELEALGVRRVTFGSWPMRSTMGLARRMAREWKEKGTYGTLEAYGIPFEDFQKLFG
jgi:2-methylisocitrate lyase-like PEP mutase family enzyme